uniref:Carbohydrate binding module family 32 protein n=1 Tax=termite gut metagenome TaxID=433724 RepID=S0DFS6_9ZZZZ
MKRILLLTLSLFFFASCDPDTPVSDQYYIEVTGKVDFNRLAANQKLDVTTNITSEISSKSTGAWCEALYANGILTVSVTANEASGSRTAIVSLEGEKIKKTVSVTQTGRSASSGDIKDDVKITVSGATASSAQNGEGIERSCDGNLSTIYHSDWNATVMPVTLTYSFASAGTMDYLVYNPRSDGGTNGNFKEFDLYVATASDPEPTLYGSYDFGGSSAAASISFSPALQNPTQIRFVVNSGMGDFASCAEMQFFRKTVDSFDYSTLFTDITCSELKSGVTRADIEGISNQFYKELALEILNGDYNSEFRVQNYKAWQHPSVMATINKTNTYSLRDNPTGIYVRTGDELIALAGEMPAGQSLALFVQDPDRMIQGSSYPISTGANKFKATNDGLIYVMYHTPTGTEPDVKINIVTGYVNGYFDSAKHTREEWTARLAAATFERFDLVGEYAHLTFETDKFRQYTPDGLALVEKFDDMVWLEQDFMGLFKYNKAFRNRMYFVVMSGSSWMHASSYYTGYDKDSQYILLSLSTFSGDPWGPAHEVGHVNQTRPGFKWRGTTEITNNVHSLYVQTRWGNTSRLIVDGVYPKAFSQILNTGTALNSHSDFFTRLVPFWQLKLYMHDALGNEDFYKDVYEAVRVNPDPATDGDCQMEFVKIACDAAKLDLTEFFEAWGFLTPISIEIDDYGKGTLTITQAMVDATKASIAAKGYPKPAHTVQDITDSNVDSFKPQAR